MNVERNIVQTNALRTILVSDHITVQQQQSSLFLLQSSVGIEIIMNLYQLHPRGVVVLQNKRGAEKGSGWTDGTCFVVKIRPEI